jgi:hypothetical protein
MVSAVWLVTLHATSTSYRFDLQFFFPFSKPSSCVAYLYDVHFTGKKLTVLPYDSASNSTFTKKKNIFVPSQIKCNNNNNDFTYNFSN